MSNEGDKPTNWTISHFSLATPEGPDQNDVPVLLETLARHIADRGNITIHDITYRLDSNEFGYWPSFTVYFELQSD